MVSLKTILLLALGVAGWAWPGPAQQSALKFDGASSYVSFGTNALGATNFTLECWFKRTGPGLAANTSSGGVAGIPLITRGRGESESRGLNCNYFLAHTIDNKLIADFEELDGPDHPVTGTHTFTSNVWHHAALAYDGTTLTLYLDGVLDQSVAASGIPDYTTRQPAALASALNSAATAAGAFAGIIDEARIWNYARTPAQIQEAMRTEITAATGLLGRWGLNDGTGATATNSVPGSPDGTLLGATMPAWTNDTPPPRPRSDRNGDESRGQHSPGHWFERHPGGRREPDRHRQHR